MRWRATRFGDCICTDVGGAEGAGNRSLDRSIDTAQESFNLSRENIGADLQS